MNSMTEILNGANVPEEDYWEYVKSARMKISGITSLKYGIQ